MKRDPRARAAPRAWFSGLDGLRALAVAAVVTFHFAPTVLPGGFLGVDLFFVISGYLITRLLLDELTAAGRISLRTFYTRRIKRLLPAVIALLTVVVVACALVWRDELSSLRGALASSLGYVTNWWLIGDHQSYFVATGRPSMLQHLWSLAIEEQFYLVWPPTLLVVTIVVARWRLARNPDAGAEAVMTAGLLYTVAAVSGLLAVASAIDMAVISIRSDIPYGADSGRVYFGTDTHSMGLLMGAVAGALATRIALPGPRPDHRFSRLARRNALFRGAFYSDLAAILSLAVLLRIALTTDEFGPWLYRGGFLLIAVLGAVLVSAAPRYLSLIPWALEWAPIRWLGSRSYSVYLWHWPVAVVTRPGLDVALHGWPLFLLRCTLTAGFAEASFRLVEKPFRVAGWLGLINAWGWHRLSGRARLRVLPAAAGLGLLVVGCLVSAVVSTSNPEPAAASGITAIVSSEDPATALGPPQPDMHEDHESALGAATTPRKSSRVPVRTATPSKARPSGPKTTTSHTSPTTATTSLTVSAFGDSVMLGAASSMSAVMPHLSLSAIEGRQARDVFNDVAAHRANHTLGNVVVIHAGDNGIISPSDLKATLSALADRTRVVVISDRVPRDWEAPNNTTLKRVVPHYANAVLVDWNGLSRNHRDWFFNDGLHLQSVGAHAYASAIISAINGK